MTRLGELGLSSYEEQVYRSLLGLGHAPAGDVADASDVPQGRVYDVLNGLAARELVHVRDTEPRTYEAVSPEIALDRLLDERREDLQAREARYEAIAAEVTADLAATVPSESRFWAAPLGSDEAVGLVAELYDAAESTVVSTMSVPYGPATWEAYAAEMDAFVEYVGEDLAVRTLVTPAVIETAPADARQQIIEGLGTVDVRVATALTISVDLIDDERACLHVPHPIDPAERLGVIEVRDDGLVADLGAVVEAAWAQATPLDAVLDDATEPSASRRRS